VVGIAMAWSLEGLRQVRGRVSKFARLSFSIVILQLHIMHHRGAAGERDFKEAITVILHSYLAQLSLDKVGCPYIIRSPE
jgi:hypothetical protein